MIGELYHYGVLGMKWGVHTSGVSKSTATKSKKSSKSNPVKKKVSVKSMSDEDLKRAVMRLQMEKQLKMLSTEHVNSGKIYTEKILKTGAGLVSATGTVVALYNNFSKIKNMVQSVNSEKVVQAAKTANTVAKK